MPSSKSIESASRAARDVRGGRNGVARHAVTEMQRARMLAAAVEVVGELGYSGMSVARVTGRAGVSRRTFYDLFAGREECFLAVCEDTLTRAAGLAQAASARERRWRARIRAGLGALLVFFDEDPLLASLCVVQALGAGARVLERRKEVLGLLGGIVDEGRSEARGGREVSPLTAEGVVGAALSLIHARLLDRDPRPLCGLLNPLMSMIVLPYLGATAAAKELSGPKLVAPRARRARSTDPLSDLDMRLTYRTLRVLAAIAAEPGASNRHVADSAGVQDQGQISKLLARLEHLGLAANSSDGPSKGEPNAWRLTPRGEQVQRTIQLQSAPPHPKQP